MFRGKGSFFLRETAKMGFHSSAFCNRNRDGKGKKLILSFLFPFPCHAKRISGIPALKKECKPSFRGYEKKLAFLIVWFSAFWL